MSEVQRPWAAVVDFDGTLVEQNLGDLVAVELGDPAVFDAVEDQFRDGTIGFRALLEGIFAPVRATADEIAAFARRRADLRAGFEALAARLHAARRPLVVCSAGLDAYIHPVLERLPLHLRDHVQVRANLARCSPDGMRVEFPGAGRGCDDCGSCKAPVVEDLQAAGYAVVFCGDGRSDRCGARAADLVFARGSLVRHCIADGVAHVTFETFDDVIAAWPERSQGV